MLLDVFELVLLDVFELVLLDVFELVLLDVFELVLLDVFELVLLDVFELVLLDVFELEATTSPSSARAGAVPPRSSAPDSIVPAVIPARRDGMVDPFRALCALWYQRMSVQTDVLLPV
ncbi:hypothetical protein GCM10023080_070780 [Streptomyces pseudoechinosporeus]